MIAFGVAVGLSEAVSILDRPAFKKYRFIVLAVFVLAAAPFLKKSGYPDHPGVTVGQDRIL